MSECGYQKLLQFVVCMGGHKTSYKCASTRSGDDVGQEVGVKHRFDNTYVVIGKRSSSGQAEGGSSVVGVYVLEQDPLLVGFEVFRLEQEPETLLN